MARSVSSSHPLLTSKITRPWIFTDSKGDKYERILIKTGTLRTPFGTSSKVFDPSQGPQHTLQPANDPDNADAAALFTFIAGLDELAVSTAIADGKWWAADKKPPSAETVNDRFRSIIKVNDDPEKDYAPTAKVKLSSNRNQEIVTRYFNTKNQPIDPFEVGPGSNFSALLELASIWFMGKEFGHGLRAQQVLYKGGSGGAFTESVFGEEDGVNEEDEETEQMAKRMKPSE